MAHKRTQIISIHSGKGGVGKTTIVSNLGARLADRGAKTLLIDADFFTRGLTFLLAQYELSANIGYLDVLNELSKNENHSDQNENIGQKFSEGSLHEVSSKLYLLPPTIDRESILPVMARDRSTDSGSFSTQLHSRNAFRKYFNNFRFVLFDCRSGTDRASIAPAFLADEYWIVTEEDNTSIRATNYLLDTIQHLAASTIEKGSAPNEINPASELPDTKSNDEGSDKVDSNSAARLPKFGGFIVNMTVSNRPEFVAQSLERIFSGRCLAVAPLSRRARQSFVHDKLVTNAYPRDPVSREITTLSNSLLKGKISSAVNRVQRRSRRTILWLALVSVLTIVTPLAAATVLAITNFDFIGNLDFRETLIVAWALGLIGGLGALVLWRRR